MQAEIINQPYSGQYKERIYDVKSPWNGREWTWIMFTDELEVKTVGQFRGSPITVRVSEKKEEIVVLTSYHTYRLNIKLDIIETADHPEFKGLEVSSCGTFIFHNSYEIEIMENSLLEMTLLESPFKMDLIEFRGWDDEKLVFECNEFANYARKAIMVLDSTDWKIRTQKNASQQNL
ncbi:hypothetical protein D9O36_05670 [Zobellia amurskyensis]|uniref:Uncharacterized protein n=1 Tax=Zobellia amurskyensis TaxID=248905 RepID=A0A7X2ZRZ4_9FLAO|nr:hypothetical protein [Zobellia amurskyensis]MUH35321.1 hypothetical protein [Zobellia amurskyensis]